METHRRKPRFDELRGEAGPLPADVDYGNFLSTSASRHRRPRILLAAIPESGGDPTPGWEALPAKRRSHGRRSQREASDLLTVKASPDHAKALRVRASIERGVLNLSIARASGDRSSDEVVVASVPIEDLAVAEEHGRTDMFVLATRHGNKLYDDICCFTDDKEKRNTWMATFRRMGVAIVDMSGVSRFR